MSQVGRGAWLDTTLHDCKREAVGDSIFSKNPCEMVSLMQIQIGLLQLGLSTFSFFLSMSWICSSNWLHMLLVPLLTLSFISSIQCHAMTSTTCDPIFTLSLITRDKIQSHPCQHFAFSLPSASSFAGNSSSIEVNSVLYCHAPNVPFNHCI